MKKKKRKKERWRWVPGYKGLYKVSSLGSVKSYVKDEKGRIMTPTVTRDGYRRVCLRKNRKPSYLRISRLMLFAFIGKPEEGEQCRHLDGNPANDTLSNLKWGTVQENADDRKRHGTVCSGEANNLAKLTNKQVIKIRDLYAKNKRSVLELADKYNVTDVTIYNIINGNTWKEIGGFIKTKKIILTEEEVVYIRNSYANKEYSAEELADKHNLHIRHVKSILTGRVWQNVGGPITHATNEKLTDKQVRKIRRLYSSGKYTQQELANKYEVTRSRISVIVTGKARKEAGGPITKSTAKSRSKVSENKVRKVLRLFATGEYLQKDIVELTGLGEKTVSNIVNRRTHTYVKI